MIDLKKNNHILITIAPYLKYWCLLCDILLIMALICKKMSRLDKPFC